MWQIFLHTNNRNRQPVTPLKAQAFILGTCWHSSLHFQQTLGEIFFYKKTMALVLINTLNNLAKNKRVQIYFLCLDLKQFGQFVVLFMIFYSRKIQNLKYLSRKREGQAIWRASTWLCKQKHSLFLIFWITTKVEHLENLKFRNTKHGLFLQFQFRLGEGAQPQPVATF